MQPSARRLSALNYYPKMCLNNYESEIFMIVYLIPAYKPDDSMLPFIKELMQHTADIVVVNDGSGPAFDHIFASLENDGVKIISYPENHGKGYALRTGFKYIFDSYTDVSGIVTADCDGQHTVKDIMRISAALEEHPDRLIVGGRALKENVPLRSRIGNSAMRNIYRLATGYKLRDTQTGLRGIPSRLFDKLLSLKGDRYEYEMNMLLFLRKWQTPPLEIRIETIYINNNEGSHFNPLKDSWRIMKHIFGFLFRQAASFFKFIASSLISYLFEYGLVQLLMLFIPSFTLPFAASLDMGIVLSNSVGRIGSSVLNYILNRKLVFRNKGRHSVIKYYGLVVAVMVLSSLIISGISGLIAAGGAISSKDASRFVKPVVDAIFFVINYFVQKKFVFNEPKKEA